MDKETKKAVRQPIPLAQPVGDMLAAGRPGRGKRGKSPARPPGWKGSSRGDVATISCEAGAWYISFPAAEHHEPAPRDAQLASRGRTRAKVIGVDVNTHEYVCSDGVRYAVPAALRDADASVRLAQQRLSGRTKGSRRYYRAKDVLAKRQARRARIRRDWLNKITYDLATRAEIVVVEDLKVKNMTRSARGTVASPGSNVAAKAGLNRSILNASFGAFREMLAYKCVWYRGRLEAVAPHHTSRTCSKCGARKDMPLSQRVYECDSCDLVLDRDLNAAINIRDKFIGLTAETTPGAPREADDTALGSS